MRADPVAHWELTLTSQVGASDAEVAVRRAALEAFCARHGIDPLVLLDTWESYDELTVRKRPGSGEPANLAVESFLIHNGINVFGEIRCVAGRAEDLAEQGAQFVPRQGRTSG